MSAEFDRYAHEYEDIMGECVGGLGQEAQYFLYYKAEYLQALLSGAAPVKILDFGCGIGAFSRILAETFPSATIHGYDISEQSIEIARRTTQAKVMYTSKTEDLDETYDLVVIANVLHHIPPEQRDAEILELWSRVGRRGRAVVFEHNPFNPMTRWVVNHCAFDADAVLLRPSEAEGYFLPRSTRVRRDYIVFFPKIVSWLKWLEPAIRWLPLGAQYAVVADK